MEYTLGIDLGSSGIKLTFLDRTGRCTGPFSAEICSVFPKPGWIEQDPRTWYEVFCALFAQACQSSGIRPEEVCAVAVDAATHTTVLLDENLDPVRNAILWNDQRSASVAAECQKQAGEYILEKTYNAPSAMWSLCQMLWVRRHEPECWQRVRRILFAKDYLRLCLGGDYVTDYIDAEGSLLLDMQTHRWDARLCGMLGKDDLVLPEILEPTDRAGAISRSCAEKTGMREGVPIYAGASDTVMELLAAGVVREGDASIKLATSGRICAVTPRPYPHALLVNYSHVVPGFWYPGTGTRSCATSLRWFKDEFCRYESAEAKGCGRSVYALLDETAASVPAGAEGLFYHPYLLGEFTPYQDPDLRADFVGASMKHTHAHFVRAVMEGCAYSLLDGYHALLEIGIPAPREFRLIGGGASGTTWSQIVSDVFQQPLCKPVTSDSSFGSAMLAAVAHGFFGSFLQAAQVCGSGSVWITPNQRNGALYQDGFGFYKEIQQALAPIYRRLARHETNT